MSSVPVIHEQQTIEPLPFDRTQVGELIEGAGVAFLSLLIAAFVVLAPYKLFERHTRSREIMLGLMVISWVLSFFAGWKLSAPRRDRSFEAARTVRRFLRSAIFVLLCIFIVCYVAEQVIGEEVFFVGAIVGVLVLASAAVAYYLLLARLMASLGAVSLPVGCTILAGLNGLTALTAFTSQLDADPSSIGTMYRAISLQFGSCEMLGELLRMLHSFRELDFWTALFLICYAASLVVHFRLLVLLLRANHRLKESGATIERFRLF